MREGKARLIIPLYVSGLYLTHILPTDFLLSIVIHQANDALNILQYLLNIYVELGTREHERISLSASKGHILVTGTSKQVTTL